ncbi:MAG: hypothetical protein ACKO7W_17375 [Elainella sp.]
MTGANGVLLGLAALLAGVFNIPVALEKLRETCKGLLFFEPVKSPGFWFWLLAQLLFPALVFLLWVTDLFRVQPPIDWTLVVKAIGAGISFTAFLNARTETVFLTLDIKSIYNGFVRLGFELIAAQETRRTKNFLRALERELQQPYVDLNEGLRDLRAYFSIDIALSPAEREQFLHSIDLALAADQSQKIQVISSLLPEVRQLDLVDTLRRFKCSDTFLLETLPLRFRRAIVQSKRS